MALTTMGWDIVFATTFQKINSELVSSDKLPKNFLLSIEDSAGSGSITGEWGTWELISGSPSNLLWMRCTVASGTFECTGYAPADISESTMTVQFGLTLIPDNTPTENGGTTYSLVPTTSGIGAPNIINYKFKNVTNQSLYVLVKLMELVVYDQLIALGPLFASIVLNSTANTDYPWLLPTSAAFACESLPTDNTCIGIFALLAMTEGRSIQGNQPVVDRRVLDDSPEGTNAALVISPNLVMSHFLRPAIEGLVQGSKEDDFALDQSGSLLYNKTTMTWGAFEYDLDSGTTSTIFPQIPKGNIQLALGDEVVHLSMSNINFPYPGWNGPGNINIAFNTEQFFTFEFVLRDDGELVMVPDSGEFNTSFNVNIIPDTKQQIFQIALDATMQILMAVIGGIVSCASEACTEMVEGALQPIANDGFVADIEMVELNHLVEEVDSDIIQQVEIEAAGEAGDAIAHSTISNYLQMFKNAIIANRYKIYTQIIKEICTTVTSEVTQIAIWAAKHQYGDLPTLNLFTETGIQQIRWADGSSFKLTGGTLKSALVLWGTLESGLL